MKTNEQLKNTPHLQMLSMGIDGGSGILRFEKYSASVIWSNGAGWEHVSISPFNHRIIPSWDDMCRVKDMFWGSDDWVVEFHPPKSEYVNQMPNCLHLWRPIDQGLPVPPSILTGIRKGQSAESVRNEIRRVTNDEP